METIELKIETPRIDFPVRCRNLNCENNQYIWMMKRIELKPGINIVRLRCEKCQAYMDETTYIIKH